MEKMAAEVELQGVCFSLVEDGSTHAIAIPHQNARDCPTAEFLNDPSIKESDRPIRSNSDTDTFIWASQTGQKTIKRRSEMHKN